MSGRSLLCWNYLHGACVEDDCGCDCHSDQVDWEEGAESED